MSGIGGALRKESNQKAIPIFLKSFAKGCLGGAFKYTAKYQAFTFNSDRFNAMLPLNRALFFLGHSVTLNASRNDAAFSNFFFNIYGVNVEVTPANEKGTRMRARLSAATAVSALAFAIDGNKLNLPRTLEFGQFFFDLNEENKLALSGSRGFAGFNSMSIQKIQDQSFFSIVPHELVHIYQAYDTYALLTYIERPIERSLRRNKLYQKMSKYVDFDYQPIFHGLLYLSQPKPTYYKNYFEYEAEHFGTRRLIPR